MEQEDMRIVWAAGVEWMVKRQDDQYVHRPEGDYGEWRYPLQDSTKTTNTYLPSR